MQHKFAMSKALEQKLIGPMEELHTKEQSPQAVLREVPWARRSKITATGAGTRAWVGFSCLYEAEEEDECRDKWRRATVGPWGRGAPCRGGRALDPRGQVLAPPAVFPVPDILKYSRKNHIPFSGSWRTFIFGVFLYCTDKSRNRQKNTILLYLY